MSSTAPGAVPAHSTEMSAPAANPNARVYRGVWSAVRPLDADTSFYQVRLDAGANGAAAGLEFRPGQFVQIYKNADPTQRSRAYSIASTPAQLPLLDFCIKRFPGGLLSAYLETVKVGDPVTLKGPFGRFILRDAHVAVASDQPIVLVATGTGIAPIRSILNSLLERKPDAKVQLVHGARHETGLYFHDEIEQLTRAHPGCACSCTCSQPSTAWQGATGYVTDVLSNAKLNLEAEYFLCGSPAVVRSTSLLLRERGVPLERIHIEKW
ncbi:MAG: FAD-binding oxidoreductase [Candidatus Andersenbacteria bacterium]